LLCPDFDDLEEAPPCNQDQCVIDELQRYRSIKLNLTDKSCPLQFYQTYENILPNLSEIAKLVFCTTASSVPSECTFSQAGLLINKKRSRLSPAIAEDLLFLKIN